MLNSSISRGLQWFTLMSVIVCLIACLPSKVNRENYDKIREGMTLVEVKAILGEPTKSDTFSGSLSTFGIPVPLSGSGTKAEWSDKDNKNIITIAFVNDKVIFKTYKGE